MSANSLQNLQAMLAQAQAQQSKPLMEFKAGILNLRGTTVTADKRRGKVVIKHGDDGLVRLQWILRPSNNKVLDVMLYPRGPTWEKVPECKDGRVYLLRFPQTNRKMFFWMQEEKDDEDDDRSKKINEIIANPPPAPGGGGSGNQQQDLMSMLQNAGLGGAGLATAAQRAGGGGATTTAAAPVQQRQQPTVRPLTLTSVLNPGRAVPVITALQGDEKDAKAMDSLLQYLPESLRTQEELKHALRVPALQQTLRRFDSMLSSVQFGSVMQSFGLRITGEMGPEAFLDAIAQQAREETEKETESKTE